MPKITDVYYPSCVVHFRLRFDEALITSVTPDPRANTGDDAPTTTQKPLSRRPKALQTGDGNTRLLNRIPKTASIQLNGYRQASTFNLTFDWRELPIDPRFIRSMSVEVHLGSVSPGDFSSGMVETLPDGRRRSVLGADRLDTLVMVGTVDNWSTDFSDNMEVSIEGRDLRGALLDSPIDPKKLTKLDLKLPIHKVVEQIIAKHPRGELISMGSSEDEWLGTKIPSLVTTGGQCRVRKGARGKTAKLRPAGGAKLSFWDLITKYCFLVGAIPFFRGNELIIRPARNIFQQARVTSDYSGTAFTDEQGRTSRKLADGSTFQHRKLVYGRDIESLAFERKMGGTKVPVIEVVSIDTCSEERGKAKAIKVQFPPKSKKKARISGVAPSGKVSETDILRVPVYGIKDKDQLFRIAQDLYEEIGRSELGGSCSTKNLASFGGGNADPDMTRIRPGDLVEFIIDRRAISSRVPLVSELIDHERRSVAEQEAEVKKALASKTGMVDAGLATVLVATARGSVARAMRYFRVANVRYSWNTGGLSISFDFQNYVVARADVGEVSSKKTFTKQTSQTGST